MARKAMGNEVLRLLREQVDDILEQLGIGFEEANLTLPTDGRGVRIKASVLPGLAESVPRDIEVFLDGEELSVDIEVVEDYEQSYPQ